MRLLLVGLAACRFGFSDVPDSAIDSKLVDAGCTFGSWGDPVLVPASFPGELNESPTLSSDGLDLYFHDLTSTALRDLFRSHRTSLAGTFDTALPLPELDSPFDDVDAAIVANGTHLYFGSDRNDGMHPQLFDSVRTGDMFSAPQVHPELGEVLGVWLSNDELEMWSGGPSQLAYRRRATPTDAWSDPTSALELGDGAYVSLTPDDLEIYIETLRDGRGSIYHAVRATPSSTFDPPALVPEVTLPFHDVGDPEISRDGRELYFDGSPSGSDIEIYVSTRACD